MSDGIDGKAPTEPNGEMLRLRAMLGAEGIGWVDHSDRWLCRTQSDRFGYDANVWWSVISGPSISGRLEVWTDVMCVRKEDPVNVWSAERAMELIRERMSE